MADESWKTLFFPFETGKLEMPPAGSRWVFLAPEPGFVIPTGFTASLTCVQGFKPYHDALLRSGHEVVPSTDDLKPGFDGALVLIGRHKGLNGRNLDEAIRLVHPGGFIVAAGRKKEGAGAVRRQLRSEISGLQDASKFHGLVMWFENPGAGAGDLAQDEDALPLVEGRYDTAPGMFSAGKIDTGSRILAETLPDDLTGIVADFGAGWGYLSAEALLCCAGIARIDLYEADHASLKAAKANLERIAPDRAARFFWTDLSSEPVKESYDAIVMNPPFHVDRATRPQLGLDMIATAAKALKKGGRLFLVANRGLPYERILREKFRRTDEVRNESGFKVIHALK